jgi:phage FluMu gp28-like protein
VLAAYRTRELWSDQWSFDALSALAVAHGIHLREAVSTQASNVQFFETLKRRIVDKTIELPDSRVVRSDLLGVSKWIAKGGAFSIELERRGSRHSDFAPAIALAVAKAAEHAELIGGAPEDADFAV